jgi:chemotaxis regulatin CheY-phosphate phosphatase CheZ
VNLKEAIREMSIEGELERAKGQLREARQQLDLIANSTEHADAAQKWELEKAELVCAFRRIDELWKALPRMTQDTTQEELEAFAMDVSHIADKMLRKYEVA